jgi:phosphotransferase system enzyme I (PtsI)
VTAGAEGIGLYRSEFMLVGGPPDMAAEDEQYHVYRELVERMGGRPDTIRTFDIDQRQLDRPLVDAALDARWFADHERGSHAGLRGIRFGLAQPGIFKTQLRALLRAVAHGPLRVMFPFVSSLHEVRAAKSAAGEAEKELRERGVETQPMPVGIMIEVPSAAFTCVAAGARSGFSHHRHERPDPSTRWRWIARTTGCPTV